MFIYMKGIIYPPDCYVKDTGTERGRGVFASHDFSSGEVIEECPVIVLRRPESELPPKIRKVVYNWGKLANTAESTVIVLGYGSMYNHDNPANMYYEANLENMTMKYIAVRNIAKDEELTVNYNSDGSPTAEDDRWFEKNEVELIKH